MKRRMATGMLLSAALLMVSWDLLPKKQVVPIDFSHYRTQDRELFYDVSLEAISESFIFQPLPKPGKSFIGFREALGFKESQSNYFVVNPYGYMGKYQFGKATLRMLGVKNTQDFLQSPKLQESAFRAYTSRNKWVLRYDIDRFAGKYMNGVLVTESGILAAAHLAGPGNVRKYLRSGGACNFSDAFGSSVLYYLKKFSGYDTSVIVPEKNARA